jgi:TetR/AcrR family transcriptional regulator, transcriptional repressor for nem operon
MKVSKDAARQNHDRLVTAAGQVIRQHGLAEAGVAQIAAAADLTHGAVYRHFASKDAIAAAAIRADFSRIVALLDELTTQGAPARAYAETYLAPDHRDHFPWGCPAAPLAAEVFRASPEVQVAFAEGLQANISALARLIDAQKPDLPAAMLLLATLVGAMALARATAAADPALSDAILAACADAPHT